MKIRSNDIYLLAIVANLSLCFLFLNKSMYIQSQLFFYGLWVVGGILFFLVVRKYGVEKKDMCLVVFFWIAQMIAYCTSMFQSLPIDFDIHRVFFFCFLFFSFFTIAKRNGISENYMEKIFAFLIISGIVSLIYDCVLNMKTILSMFDNIWNLKYNGVLFTSFFSTRTECAYHAFLCICCCVYMIVKYNKKKYYVFYILILIHIILTGARMPLAMALAVTLVMFALDSRFKKQTGWLVCFILVLIAVNYRAVIGFYNSFIIEYLSHTGSGVDTGVDRLEAWSDLLSNIDLISFFVGHGMGSQTRLTQYYSPDYVVAGYHSMYIDAFCQGGILQLGIIIYSLFYTVKKVIKSKLSRDYKVFAMSLMVAYAGSLLTDSLGSLFDYQMFSLMSTSFVIGIPLARVSVQESKRN